MDEDEKSYPLAIVEQLDTDRAGEATDPSPVSGADRATFDNLLSRALQGDESVPAEFRIFLEARSRDQTNAHRSDRTDAWELFFWQRAADENLRGLNELVRRYTEMANFHRDQAEQARAAARDASDHLAEADRFISGVDDVLGNVDRGQFDRDKVVALLKSRGVAVDANAEPSILLVRLREEKLKAESERARWSLEYDRTSRDASYHERMEQENLKAAHELAAKIDEVHGHGYDAPSEAEELRKLSARYGADVQFKAADLQRQENHPDQAAKIDAAIERNAVKFQTKDETADFLVASSALSSQFASAAHPDQPAAPELGVASPTSPTKVPKTSF